MGIDMSAHYTVSGYRGIAFRITGYAKVWETATVINDDGTLEAIEGEGEWVDDTDSLVMVMIGDDRKHYVSPDDITLLPEGDYCAECGQVGCTHDGRDRD